MPRCPAQQSAASGQPSPAALQQPGPAVLQQPGTQDATVKLTDDGYSKCTLCNKYVTEDHLQSRQHKRLLAAQEATEEEPAVAAEEDTFRSLGDDFRDDTWGYTRAEWDEWHAWNAGETGDTYG